MSLSIVTVHFLVHLLISNEILDQAAYCSRSQFEARRYLGGITFAVKLTKGYEKKKVLEKCTFLTISRNNMSFAGSIQMIFFPMLTCTIGFQGGPNEMAAAYFP